MYAKNMKSSRGQAPLSTLGQTLSGGSSPQNHPRLSLFVSQGWQCLGKFPCLNVGLHHGLRSVTGVSFAAFGVWEMNFCTGSACISSCCIPRRSDGRISPPRAGGLWSSMTRHVFANPSRLFEDVRWKEIVCLPCTFALLLSFLSSIFLYHFFRHTHNCHNLAARSSSPHVFTFHLQESATKL